MCWHVSTDAEQNKVCVLNTHTLARVQCYDDTAYGLARANALVTAMEVEAKAAEDRAKEEVDKTYEFLEAVDMLRSMIDAFAKAAGARSDKAHSQTVGKILEGKIHEAFTVAADQLFMRGYLARDERIQLSSLIGDILGSLSESSAGIEGTRLAVSPSDVVDIARKEREHGVVQTFSVVDKEGPDPRWLLVSSCNYEDRDKQIVSEAALRKAVLLGDLIGRRGPLLWWHTKKEKALTLGNCDLQVVYKGFLVESGTFVSKAVADAIGRVAHNLRASIGFIHPDSEPDRDGVFHNIAILERSLLPSGAESNPFTSLVLV